MRIRNHLLAWSVAALTLPSPVVAQLAAPRLVIASVAEQPISLRSVGIRTEISGSLALTSVELTFFNPNHRQLEGELQFPLLDGQSVVGMAMDVDGRLRDAVPVAADVRRRILERRQRIWAAEREEWRLPRAALATLAAGLPRNVTASATLKERLEKGETKARATVLHAYPQLAHWDARQLHDFRRALRRLRYLCELELSQRQARRDTRLQLLIELQRILGAQQDRGVAQRWLVENAEAEPVARCLDQPAGEEREWRSRFQKIFLAAARAHCWRITARPKSRRPVGGRRE